MGLTEILLPLLLAQGAPETAPSDALRFELRANQKTIQRKALFCAEGESSFPPQTILLGNLAYRSVDPPEPLITRFRAAVRDDGTFAIPLDAGFRDAPFPGTYEIRVELDEERNQPRATQDRMQRDRSLKRWHRAMEVVVGGPDSARDEARRLRDAWRGAYRDLDRLGHDAEAEFRLHRGARAFQPAAWQAKRSAWQSTLDAIDALDISRPVYGLLKRLDDAWSTPSEQPLDLIRTHLSERLRDLVRRCDDTLYRKAAPGDLEARWMAYHAVTAVILRDFPLFRRDASASLGIVARLRDRVRSLQAWVDAWASKAAGHETIHWQAWRDAWKVQVDGDLMQLLEAETDADRVAETQAVAARCVDLEETAQRILSERSAASSLPPAIEAALGAIDRLEAQWKKP
jgi:hypothetical protein